MKKYSLVITFLCCINIVVCQAPKMTDLKLYAGYGFDNAADIKVDKNNNYYLSINMSNSQKVSNDSFFIDCRRDIIPFNGTKKGFLLRYDSTKKLNLVIENPYGFFGKFGVDSLGNIYINGSVRSSVGPSSSSYISKYSKTGSLIWSRNVESFTNGRSEDCPLTCIDVANTGEFCFTGFSYGTLTSIFGSNISGPANYVVKASANGNVLWINKFSTTLGFGAYCAKFDKAKNVLVGGNETNATNNTWLVIAKMDSSTGDLVWKKRFSSSNYFFGGINSIGILSDSYVFGGSCGVTTIVDNNILNSFGKADVFLLKSDFDGNVKWAKNFGSPELDGLSGIAITPTDDIVFTGAFSKSYNFNGTIYNPQGNTDAFVSSIDKFGNTLWFKNGGSNKDNEIDDYFTREYGTNLAIDSKNQIQVIGDIVGIGSFGNLQFYASENSRQNIFWLTMGNVDAAKVVKDNCYNPLYKVGLPIRVLPNPFSDYINITFPDTEINYSGVAFINYEVSLCNALGQVLKNISFTTTGSTTIKIDNLGNLAKGFYFLKLKSSRDNEVFKLIKN